MSDRWKTNARSRLVDALVLSALLLFGALARIVHDSTVAHVVCPQHGELLHVAHPPDAESATHSHEHATELTAPSESLVGPQAVPTGAQSEHDECWFATLLKPGSAPWIGTPAHFVPPASERCDESVDANVRVAVIPTLSFAPKHSPPSRSA